MTFGVLVHDEIDQKGIQELRAKRSMLLMVLIVLCG